MRSQRTKSGCSNRLSGETELPLPEVSWLVPDVTESEHPPQNVKTGMWYVTQLINVVMQSSYWKRLLYHSCLG
jgi:phospholipase C